MFLEDLSKWLFQETGVLRVERTHHYREGETEPRDEYTKKDLVVSSCLADCSIGQS
jgi:oligosaccharyltransferase complex subunit beta